MEWIQETIENPIYTEVQVDGRIRNENCLFVRKNLKENIADQIMSHGVQLPDIFDALPVEATQREFQRELTTMHSLCLKLIGDKRIAA